MGRPQSHIIQPRVLPLDLSQPTWCTWYMSDQPHVEVMECVPHVAPTPAGPRPTLHAAPVLDQSGTCAAHGTCQGQSKPSIAHAQDVPEWVLYVLILAWEVGRKGVCGPNLACGPALHHSFSLQGQMSLATLNSINTFSLNTFGQPKEIFFFIHVSTWGKWLIYTLYKVAIKSEVLDLTYIPNHWDEL